jgi:uncharacterized membrane protein
MEEETVAENFVAYAAAYDNADDARDDFDTLADVGLRHITAALVRKTDEGRIHVHEKTYSGKVGATAGVVGGAILGAIFPPAGVALVADGALGGATLGTISHFAGGLSRSDLKELGAMLDEGDAAVIAVGVDAVAQDVDKALSKASRKASKAIDNGDVEAALQDLAKGFSNAEDDAVDDLS